MCELHRPVPLLLIECRARERCVFFFRMHVDLRLREVGQTARVVEVEVREHEVSHVFSPKAKRLDLR